MNMLAAFFNLEFGWHLAVGFIVRLVLILYGNYHDRVYDVPYTDVDYTVFTDAARHILEGRPPYVRLTYRYSPILAYIMIPNVVIAVNFGKFLFSIFDLLVAYAVKLLVEDQLKGHKARDNRGVAEVSKYSSLFWLYNPLSIAISTRGNADSVPCFFVILSVLFFQTNTAKGSLKYVISGLFLAISIHLRLYPLAFSLPMYLSLGEYRIWRNSSIKDSIISLLPNKRQITLATSCVATLAFLTWAMYSLYGYEFIFETYIYHLFRKDTRHNFSVLFFYTYLTMEMISFDLIKMFSQIFQLAILLMLSWTFGCEQKTLSFALFCQAVVLVTYNSVVTSQYFVWFLSLLPLVVHNFKIAPSKAATLTALWFLTQALWLFFAYLLEFKSREVFHYIWLQGIMFFSANIYILGFLIKCFSPGYGFGRFNKVSKKRD